MSVCRGAARRVTALQPCRKTQERCSLTLTDRKKITMMMDSVFTIVVVVLFHRQLMVIYRGDNDFFSNRWA